MPFGGGDCDLNNKSLWWCARVAGLQITYFINRKKLNHSSHKFFLRIPPALLKSRLRSGRNLSNVLYRSCRFFNHFSVFMQRGLWTGFHCNIFQPHFNVQVWVCVLYNVCIIMQGIMSREPRYVQEAISLIVIVQFHHHLVGWKSSECPWGRHEDSWWCYSKRLIRKKWREGLTLYPKGSVSA